MLWKLADYSRPLLCIVFRCLLCQLLFLLLILYSRYSLHFWLLMMACLLLLYSLLIGVCVDCDNSNRNLILLAFIILANCLIFVLAKYKLLLLSLIDWSHWPCHRHLQKRLIVIALIIIRSFHLNAFELKFTTTLTLSLKLLPSRVGRNHSFVSDLLSLNEAYLFHELWMTTNTRKSFLRVLHGLA